MGNKVTIELNNAEINFLAHCLDVYTKQGGLNVVSSVQAMAAKLGQAAKELGEVMVNEETE